MSGSDILAVLAIILGPLLAIGGVIYTNLKTSKNAAASNKTANDSNDIARLQLLIDGFTGRIASLETEVNDLKEKDGARSREMVRMRRIIRDWFKQLRAEWPKDVPMPLPSEEDMELLGIAGVQKD